MKKKVRIYKAPDGKGKFVNKTAKFLRKAQEGGQQDQQAQISDYVYKTLANTDELDMEMMKDSLIGELVAAKIPMDQAEQMVENIAANFESQEPVQEQEEETDVYDEGLAELERQQQEAEEERLAGLSEDYGYYDDTAADGEDEEDEEDYDDEEEAAYMQQGGDIIPEDNAVSFTGYDPYEYNQDKQNSYKQGGITKRKYIGQVMKLLKKQAGGEEEKPSAGFDPTDTMDNKKKNKKDSFVAALANSAQEAKMKEQAEAMWEQQQQQMMQQQAPMQQQQFAQKGAEVEEIFSKNPPRVGETNSEYLRRVTGNPGFFNNTDKWDGTKWVGKFSDRKYDLSELPEDDSPEDLLTSSGDVGILPGQSDIVGLPRRGEPGYQEPRSGTPPYIGSSPNIYGSNPSVSPRQMRRMIPRGFGRNQMRSFAGMVPQGGFFPMGMNIMTYPMQMPEQKPIHVQGTMPGMKLDVRKSHWLTGRPSQYSIEFGGDFAIPGFNMMPGKGYGYKSSGRKTIEGVSRIVNKAADPGKSNKVELNNNPDPEKKNSADAVVADQSNVVKDKEGNPITSNASNMMWNSSGTNMPTAENLEAKSSSTTPDNSNKKVIGDNSKLPPKPEAKKVNTVTKSKQPGQNKPAASSAKVTNKGKATVTAKPKTKLNFSNVTEPKSAPAKTSEFSMIPDWMQEAIRNNQAKDAANYKILNDFMNYRSPLLDQQSGGFVDSSNPDLYKFVYGGDDVITQQDMNYSDSRNTGSPFFAYGGHIKYQDKGEVKEDDYDKYLREKAEQEALDEYNAFMNRGEGDKNKMVKYKANTNDAIYNKILGQSRKKYNIADPNEKPKVEEKKTETKQKQEESDYQGSTYNPYGGYGGGGYRPNAFGRYFPANTVRRVGTWTQQQGMPYDPRTGAGYFGGFGPGTQLSKIDVRKSGWLSGRPKKYTMYFNNAEMDPTKPQFSINTGAGASSSDTGSTSQSAGNKKATNAKEFFGYSDAEWDKMSAREKRQEKRNMKSQEWVDSLPDPEAKDNEFEGDIGTALTPSGPSAEDIAARDAATEANKGVIRNFSEVEGVQDDPFGIGMGGPSEEPSDFEESTQTYDSPEAANEYVQGEWGDIMTDVSEVLGPESQQEFDQFLATNPSKGQIDAKIEDFMRQRNQVIGKDAEALERDALTADAEEEMMNQEAMRRNPMFMGSSGAPAANPNFGATPEIATGQDYQLSDREKADMDYFMQNRRSAPVDFQPRSGRLTESNIFSNRDQVIPNTRKPSEDLANLAYTDSLPALPASPLETANYEDMLLNNFPQYTDAFEGAASNDEQYLPGTMDGMSEGSVRNREIAAKQKYNQQQAAIRQQQLLQQQQQQQAASGSKSGSGKSSNAALKEKALNSNRQAKQSGDWRDTWDIKGVINKNKNQLETLKDSPIGQKTLFAIDSRWENMSEKQRKAYGSFDKYLKTEGYDKFYNTMQGKISQIAKTKKKKKQFGGALSRFLYGDEVTKTSTGKDSPVVYTNNPTLEGLRDVDLVGSDDSAITTLQPSSFWSDQQSFNKPTMDFQTGCTEEEKKDPKSACYDMEKYGMKVQEDALGSARETTEKKYAPKAGQFAVDFKNKNAYEVDAQGMLLSGNALARGLFGALDRRSSRKQNKDFYDRFTSDNLYASDPSRDRGDYETNSGLKGDMGSIWTSRSKQLGGFMQSGGFAEGDVIDMTPEELEEFLANGGEVEIIS